MKNRPDKYKLIVTLVLIMAGPCVRSQNYPIQATLQISPPYSLYLQDYVSENNRLLLMVLMKDLNRSEYRVRFRFSLEGNGVSIVTNPNYLPPPVILQGGVPLALSGPELADYFNPFNLTFSGITRQEFQKAGRLPAGPYRICVEVIDYNIAVAVSNQSCYLTWLVLNDPPLINLPFNNTKVRATDPQNLVFQWTPRHTASPNAAFSTEYYFRMVEVWPAERNPFDALNVGTPLFETVTTQTTLIYSLADPPLVPGRRYAFRVQARQSDGGVARDLFKNSGYSEVYTFIYGDECKFPVNIRAESPYPNQLKINWESATGNTEYTLLYKESGTSMAWREENTFLTAYTLSSLKPGTTYDIQMAGRCGTFRSELSPLLTKATNTLTPTSFECGRLPAAFNLDNTEPLVALNAGEKIQSGDFDVEVTEVTGSNGTFTGKGSLLVPFLNYVKVQVTFQAITINTDKQVIKGTITATGVGL
jgi:TANFOR domain-containing protein